MKRPPPEWTRARRQSEQEQLLAIVSLRRHQAKEQPLVTYRCGKGQAGGRGDCTMLEVWASKLGPVLFTPARTRPRRVTYTPHQPDHDPLFEDPRTNEGERLPKLPAQAHVLEEWVQRLGEQVGTTNLLLTDLLVCRHGTASIEVARLRQDVTAQVGTVLVSHGDERRVAAE